MRIIGRPESYNGFVEIYSTGGRMKLKTFVLLIILLALVSGCQGAETNQTANPPASR